MKDRLESQFVLRGKQFRATREDVEKALAGLEPEQLKTDWVTIGGRRYPVRQAFAVAFGIPRYQLQTKLALRVLRALGFDVYRGRPVQSHQTTHGTRAGATAAEEQRPKPRFPYVPLMPSAAESQRLDLGAVELRWSAWYGWEDLAKDPRADQGIYVPEGTPGVYEAKVDGEKERLVIGRAADLQSRVRAGLVKGALRHVAGAKIRAHEDLSRVRVRWAVTDRTAAVEEELHKQHQQRLGRLPKYTEHT